MNAEEREVLKYQLEDLIEEGKKITVSWDCGGDEAFAYTHIDGQQLVFGDPLGEAMDMYLINRLDLPSAGEFSLKGKGTIELNDEELWITYASESEFHFEWDEEMIEEYKKYNDGEAPPLLNEEEGMTPDSDYSGSVLLFLE